MTEPGKAARDLAQHSAGLAALLGGVLPQAPPGALLGIEHEYQLSRNGSRLDFRGLIHGLDVPGRRLDPGDVNAYRCASGLVLTCDEQEAEVASPPVVVSPSFTQEIAAWSTAGVAQLRRLIPEDDSVTGFSTHLSASLANDQADATLNLLVRAFAPALMLLLDGPISLGIYLRPRPGRLELCGEYISGDYLRAVSAFYAGAVRACAAAVADKRNADSKLPPLLSVAARPAIGRFGVYVGRFAAFDLDLYTEGRNASLPLEAGGSIRAQEHIEQSWAIARTYLLPVANRQDLENVDALVSSALPFRIESGPNGGTMPPRACEPEQAHVLGRVIQPLFRPQFALDAEIATWDFTVYTITGQRQAFVCVPRANLSCFLSRLQSGSLDATIESYLETPPSGRQLADNVSTRGPGLWDELGAKQGLLPAEREALAPQLPQRQIVAESGNLADRPGKAWPGETRGGKWARSQGPDFLPRENPTESHRTGRAALQELPDSAGQSEVKHGGRGRRFVYAATAALVLLGVILALAANGSVFGGGASPTATETPLATSTQSAGLPAASTVIATRTEVATPPAGAGGAAVVTRAPLEVTEAPNPAVSTLSVPTATRSPAPDETRTPTPTAVCGAAAAGICSPTPNVVATSTPVAADTPSVTPTCVARNAAIAQDCTPTPTPTRSTLTATPTQARGATGPATQ